MSSNLLFVPKIYIYSNNWWEGLCSWRELSKHLTGELCGNNIITYVHDIKSEMDIPKSWHINWRLGWERAFRQQSALTWAYQQGSVKLYRLHCKPVWTQLDVTCQPDGGMNEAAVVYQLMQPWPCLNECFTYLGSVRDEAMRICHHIWTTIHFFLNVSNHPFS